MQDDGRYEKRGSKKATEKATMETTIVLIKNMMDTTGKAAEEIMRNMKIPASEFSKYMAML